MEPLKSCRCGCGKLVVRKSNRFIHGHNSTKGIPRNRIPWNKGLTKETDSRVKLNAEAVSRTVKKLHEDPEYVKRYRKGREKMDFTPWNKGLTKETDERIKIQAKMNSEITKEAWENNPEQFATARSEEANAIRSSKMKGKKRDLTPEQRASLAWNRGLTKQTDERISKSAEKTSRTMREKFLDPDFCKAWGRARRVKPNKLELQFQGFLDGLFPGEYEYVGNFQYFIGGKNPDFANVDGQKKLIELYGQYWHEGEDPQVRIDHFKRFGFDTLVVWEDDFLDDRGLVKRQLVEFHGAGCPVG